MLENTPCTIFCYRKIAGIESFVPVVIPMCLWTPKTETVPTANGFKKNNTFEIFIEHKKAPIGKTYIGANAYALLDDEEYTKYWTVNPLKDRILKGLTDETDIAKIIRLDDCFTVQSVQFYEYGLKHWEITGG